MELNKVHFKDARRMDAVDDASIALVVTSPPYWNIKDYSLDGFQANKRTESKKEQIGDIDDFQAYISSLLDVWVESERVLKPNGKLAINSPLMPIPKKVLNTHHTRDIIDINAAIQQSILKDTDLFLYDVWIWNRTNPSKKLMFGSYPYPPNFFAQNTIEFITVYVKGGKPVPRAKDIKAKSKLTEEQWLEYTKQVWNIRIPTRGDAGFGIHPAIMPEEIARRLIRLFTFAGDTVLDPFLGSGTTAKVAAELHRNWIGYEIDTSYAAIIADKVKNSDSPA